jgi:hypothetical protein
MKAILTAYVSLSLTTTACASGRPVEAPAAGVHGDHTNAPGYGLVIQATSCWMGGLWSDALGETDDTRTSGIDRRCNALLRDIEITAGERDRALADHVPPPAPEEAYYPLRAVEPHIVDAIARKVEERAARDPAEGPHAHELVVLLRAGAAATRETIQARRYADRVRDDVRAQPNVVERNVDKESASVRLQRGEALDALFHVDAGAYTDDARAMGALIALDRMQIAHGLPMHLKIYVVRTGFADMFGVSAPNVSDDAAKPIPSGMWLAYLTQVAGAAGHPIPSDAHDPQNREPLAWTGVLEGFADRLRADLFHFPAGNALGEVERATVVRLDEEYKSERAAYEAHAAADR